MAEFYRYRNGAEKGSAVRRADLYSEQRDKIPERQQSILSGHIRHSFRVPLRSEDRSGKVSESFRRCVGSVLYDKQVLAGQINTLMMIAVDKHMGTEEGVQEMTGQIVGRVKHVFLRILVQFPVAHLSDCAAKIEVDELHALTDAEDGLILLIEQIQCMELFQSERHVGRGNMAETAVIIFSAYAGKGTKRTAGCIGIAGRQMEKRLVVGERGQHIAAAGQKQSVKNFRMLFYV